MKDLHQSVVAYHDQTKHHLNRYARSLGYLDWATQPDPFRRFDGAPLHPLSLTGDVEGPSYDDLFRPGAIPPSPLEQESVSAFFQLSLALSAWKEYQGSRWALRINPSSGNLHPTEGYLIAGPIPGLHDEPAVYHYAPKGHALERRTTFPDSIWHDLTDGSPPGTFLVALTSIHWREAWKYGERAFRYCQHDVGHALAAVAFAAAMQGWESRMLGEWGDDQIAALLGLNRPADFAEAEDEQPDLLVAVAPSASSRDAGGPSLALRVRNDSAKIQAIERGSWIGQANRLSAEHVEWAIIDEVTAACRKPVTEAPEVSSESFAPMIEPRRESAPARRTVRQRRSAVALDGTTTITAEQFYLMLDRTLPRWDRVPWSTLGPPVCVHLALFVHLVRGIPPGLYALARRVGAIDELKSAMTPSFLWEKPDGCPDHLPLYLLVKGDARRVAGQVSCHQDIAADGAFSLGMLAEFERPLQSHGPWFYRRLFWETGMIGQVLYLEAEAAGIRGTGIGCFFDDAVHELLGLKDHRFQSLYHFTLGGPVEDARLTTLPAYPDPGESPTPP